MSVIKRGFFEKTLPHKTWGPHPKRESVFGDPSLINRTSETEIGHGHGHGHGARYAVTDE